MVIAGIRTYLYPILHKISSVHSIVVPFCDQSNLIWREFENVFLHVRRCELSGDVDFRQSYFTCGV